MKPLSALASPDGVLLVDKAEGMTSHDVVALARRQLGTKKIGHCGTLDPLATGLLLLTVGRGTKIQDLLMSEDKEYVGTFELGVTTDTQDREGEVIQRRPVPPLDENQIRAACGAARGRWSRPGRRSTGSSGCRGRRQPAGRARCGGGTGP